jgi:hypothetical protein
LVFVLNNLLKDCKCSNPNWYAISLTDKSVADNFSLAFAISFSWMYCCVFCPVSILSRLLFEAVNEELNYRIDAFSQDVLISQLELLLQHSNRFYNRQFITSKRIHHDLIDHMQNYLSSHFNGDMGSASGLPTAQDTEIRPCAIRYLQQNK